MKISNIEYRNRTKFFAVGVEFNGQTYEIFVQEHYHRDRNWQRGIEIMAMPEVERLSFFPEMEKHILDNIDDILKSGE